MLPTSFLALSLTILIAEASQPAQESLPAKFLQIFRTAENGDKIEEKEWPIIIGQRSYGGVNIPGAAIMRSLKRSSNSGIEPRSSTSSGERARTIRLGLQQHAMLRYLPYITLDDCLDYFTQMHICSGP